MKLETENDIACRDCAHCRNGFVGNCYVCNARMRIIKLNREACDCFEIEENGNEIECRYLETGDKLQFDDESAGVHTVTAVYGKFALCCKNKKKEKIYSILDLAAKLKYYNVFCFMGQPDGFDYCITRFNPLKSASGVIMTEKISRAKCSRLFQSAKKRVWGDYLRGALQR
ncbi:MAG: hypothetical protein LBQ47_09000 [Endomicrobium sp.]|nr:hypothetical protein [Endomicrobium sp.]